MFLIINPIGIGIIKFGVAEMVALFLYDQKQGDIISNAYIKPLMENFKKKTFNPSYFCEVLVPICQESQFEVLKVEDYTNRILSDKPESIQNNDFIDKLYQKIEDDKKNGIARETMLMYHFSDLHWNMKYEAGTSDDCGTIVCCSNDSGVAPSEDKSAGKWGDYRCDANPKLFHQIIYTLNMTGSPDFIIWTGDNTAHSIEKDPHVTTNATVAITEFIENHSPDSVIFPIHGNHEFNPMNVQDFNKKIDPVIEYVSEAWSKWLTPEVKEEYLKKTYYSYDAVTHPDTTPEFKRKMTGTRIIAMNTQNCYFFNFQLVGQTNDPGQELEWLEATLRDVEAKNEVAIIVGHISPGVPDCLSVVSLRLRALMDRFQHVVRLNLFGHTHNEEFEVVRSVGDGKPINVNHLTPSFTTFTGRNPSFRAITLDVKTKLPVKIQTYTVFLDKANVDDENAKFVFSHELASEYRMDDLRPSNFLNITTRFMTDEDLAVKYKYNMYAGGQGADPIKTSG